jgi:hypothetical protein
MSEDCSARTRPLGGCAQHNDVAETCQLRLLAGRVTGILRTPQVPAIRIGKLINKKSSRQICRPRQEVEPVWTASAPTSISRGRSATSTNDRKKRSPSPPCDAGVTSRRATRQRRLAARRSGDAKMGQFHLAKTHGCRLGRLRIATRRCGRGVAPQRSTASTPRSSLSLPLARPAACAGRRPH